VSQVQHRVVETNAFACTSPSRGPPLVVLCHGFPESWYSWRHQLPALAQAGFHAVAPDMRGYGQSGWPEAIDQYTLFHLVGDMVACSTRWARSRPSSSATTGAPPSPGTPPCCVRTASAPSWA